MSVKPDQLHVHSGGVDLHEFDHDAVLEERSEEVIADPATMEFALEAYLEEFIVTNWDLIDWGAS